MPTLHLPAQTHTRLNQLREYYHFQTLADMVTNLVNDAFDDAQLDDIAKDEQ